MTRPVALVCSPDPRDGRIAPRVRRLARALGDAGQPVVIWVADAPDRPAGRGGRAHEWKRDSTTGETSVAIPVRHLPSPLPGSTIRSRVWGSRAVGNASREWQHALRVDRPALLDVQGFGSGGVYALSLARREKTPLVVSSAGETLDRGPRGVDRQPGLLKPFVQAIRQASALTAISHPVRDDLHLRFGAEGVVVIPDGVDPAIDVSFEWSDIPWRIDGRRVVFAAGAVDARSGFDLLVGAAGRSTVAHRLVIGGDGSALAGLKEWSKRIGGAASIEWAGPLSARQIAAGMDHADVVVLPNRVNTDVSEIVSAWKIGTPLVASATAGAVSVIHHGMDGLLAPLGQSASLAECVGRLLIDHRLAEGLVAEGKRRVASLSWETTAERYREVFQLA